VTRQLSDADGDEQAGYQRHSTASGMLPPHTNPDDMENATAAAGAMW